MTTTAILLVAALVFVGGTVRAVRRQRYLAERRRAVAQLRSSIHAARVAADQAQANRRND